MGITKFILENIVNIGGSTLDFVHELDLYHRWIMAKGYHPSLKWKDYLNKHRIRWKKTVQHSEVDKYMRHERQKIRNIIYRLQKQGFVQRSEGKDGYILKITEIGKKRLKSLRDRVCMPHKIYKRESLKEVIIVVFDIPEKLSYARNWLRSTLLNMGFKKLQKSVCSGKIKIPQQLIEDIHELKLSQFVRIFRVVEEGVL